MHDMTQPTMPSGFNHAKNRIWSPSSGHGRTVSVDLLNGSFSTYYGFGYPTPGLAYGEPPGDLGFNGYLNQTANICVAPTKARPEVQGPESRHHDVPIDPLKKEQPHDSFLNKPIPVDDLHLPGATSEQDARQNNHDTLESRMETSSIHAQIGHGLLQTSTAETPWPRSPLYAKLFGDEPLDEYHDSDTASLRSFKSGCTFHTSDLQADESPTQRSSNDFTREVPPARKYIVLTPLLHTPSRGGLLQRGYLHELESHYDSEVERGQALGNSFGSSDQIPIQ